MFHSQQSFAGAASRRYAAVHAGSRIESASPHGLVKILFDELLLSIEASALAQETGDQIKTNDKHIRAMSILHALEASLDFEKGGDIAVSLARVYREARRLLVVALHARDSREARAAQALIAEIAEAWNKIG